MMNFEHNGKRYTTTLGSDVVEDGMYLEMAKDSGEIILVAFYSDAGKEFTFYCYEKERKRHI